MTTEKKENCSECGAIWQEGLTCQDHFHQLLFWEAEDPALGGVHHLMVLSYHLQHPSLYSPEGLEEGKRLLNDFLKKGLSTEEVRRNRRREVDSGNRTWKVRGKPGSYGAYDQPIQWKMTVGDVVAAGKEKYLASVQAWAESVASLTFR